MGRHRRNQLCNRCGRTEGSPDDSGKPITLLVDLEQYSDEERIFQAPRSPENPLPLFLVWCVDCANQMVVAGDPIVHFREFGYEENSPDGPYANYLKLYGTGVTTRRPGTKDR